MYCGVHAPQAEMLANRLRKNERRLRDWARRSGVACYRLYDRDIPEVPLAIDWYDGHLHVSQYAAAHKEHTEAPGWLDAMVEAAAQALGVPPERRHVKRRERQRGGAQYERFGARGERLVVPEGGHRFYVNLDDYLDTGLFLDHRPLRARVEAEAAGRRFLNLFCYTAAFTVYAAAGGAVASTSVDLSGTYLDWARDNLELNGLASPAHRFVRSDVRAFLAETDDRWDLVVLDPPTFSRSKRTPDDLDLQRDHAALVGAVRRVLRPGGVVYFSTNNRHFRLDPQIAAGAEDISEQTIPPDFRDRRIHRCWRIT
jgi:23S rRNA G2069 N7-methylase RlmK/C1962 C5-methylase RlmI